MRQSWQCFANCGPGIPAAVTREHPGHTQTGRIKSLGVSKTLEQEPAAQKHHRLKEDSGKALPSLWEAKALTSFVGKELKNGFTLSQLVHLGQDLSGGFFALFRLSLCRVTPRAALRSIAN